MSTELAQSPARQPEILAAVSLGFENADTFALLQRAAKLLSNSTLVPPQYRALKEIKEYGKVVRTEDNPNAVANCVIALNIARRMRADELMVMQNLYVVEGRPSWSAQWVIAAVNTCGKFTPLRFEITDLGPQDAEYTVVEWENGKKIQRKEKQKIQNLQCVAWATEKETGQRVESPPVTMEMAVAEGWFSKSGSKWQTMPQVMLRYRAASFFGKLYAPELLMGLPTAEELHDLPVERPAVGREVPAAEVPRLLSGAGERPSAGTSAEPSQALKPDSDRLMQQLGDSSRVKDRGSLTADRADTSPPNQSSRAPAVSQGIPTGDRGSNEGAAEAMPQPSPEDPGPRELFWAKCAGAKLDDNRVLEVLRKNGMTSAEWPADVTDDEATAAMTPKAWRALVELCEGKEAK